METTISISPRPSPPLSPPLTTNLHRPHHLCLRLDVQDQAQFSMPLIDLTIQRIITTKTPFQFRFKNPLSLNNHITSIRPKIMADEEPKKTDTQSTTLNVSESKDEEKKESEKPSAPPTPPPPEKPLPGDCCGSGCVRCVWDVYYEELEEYNRLHKKRPPLGSIPKWCD